MRTAQSNLLNNKYVVATAHLVVSFGLMACQAKITTKVDDVNKFQKITKVETEGSWASQCSVNTKFGFSEINVLEFSGSNVKYDNYHYSDSTCGKLSFEDHKLGNFSFGQQNNDNSYDIDFAIDIGQGAQQLFFDVIKRDGDKLFFGESLAPGENYRSHSVDINRPYSKVEAGYKPTKPLEPTPLPSVEPKPTITPKPPIVDSTFLGEVQLSFSENHMVADYAMTNGVYKYFKYSAITTKSLYLSSIMSSDTCNYKPTKKLEWLEVAADGSLGPAFEITMSNSFTAQANRNYVLRFTLTGIKNCYSSYSFSIGE